LADNLPYFLISSKAMLYWTTLESVPMAYPDIAFELEKLPVKKCFKLPLKNVLSEQLDPRHAELFN
jgi:hypothetical protein